MDDLEHARALADRLGDLFSLTYVKGVDEAEALRRSGAQPAASAGRAGDWAVVLELSGDGGADHERLAELSLGTEAVVVVRDDDRHAVLRVRQGRRHRERVRPELPGRGADVGRADPEMLRPLMRAIGIRTPDDETDEPWVDAPAKAIVLAQRITGARLPDTLAG